jgi:chaperone modulatory protein CbpM
MTPRALQAVWLNEYTVCSIEHLAEVSGLSIAELSDLVDSGVIEPVDQAARPPAFYLGSIVTANTARRLRDDFELDRNGLALALRLIQRIRRLELELQRVAGRWPGAGR